MKRKQLRIKFLDLCKIAGSLLFCLVVCIGLSMCKTGGTTGNSSAGGSSGNSGANADKSATSGTNTDADKSATKSAGANTSADKKSGAGANTSADKKSADGENTGADKKSADGENTGESKKSAGAAGENTGEDKSASNAANVKSAVTSGSDVPGKSDPSGGGEKADVRKTDDKSSGTTDAKGEIPSDMRQDGMIDSSTYQVFITAFGSSEEEARLNGLTEARHKAFNLMRKDPALQGKSLGSGSLQELRQLIARNGKIVRIQQEPNGSWSVVLRIEKEGLRGYLRRLR